MEIIIAVAVFGFGLWWIFLRKTSDVIVNTAPYKVETPPVAEPESVTVVEAVSVPVAVTEQITDSVTQEPAPVKKPRKPRAPKVVAPAEKPAAKKAAPVKKAAAIKAAPKKPRSKKS